MMSFIAEAQSSVEELKMFLEVDSLEEIKRSWINLYGYNPPYNESRF